MNCGIPFSVNAGNLLECCVQCIIVEKATDSITYDVIVIYRGLPKYTLRYVEVQSVVELYNASLTIRSILIYFSYMERLPIYLRVRAERFNIPSMVSNLLYGKFTSADKNELPRYGGMI